VRERTLHQIVCKEFIQPVGHAHGRHAQKLGHAVTTELAHRHTAFQQCLDRAALERPHARQIGRNFVEKGFNDRPRVRHEAPIALPAGRIVRATGAVNLARGRAFISRNNNPAPPLFRNQHRRRRRHLQAVLAKPQRVDQSGAKLVGVVEKSGASITGMEFLAGAHAAGHLAAFEHEDFAPGARQDGRGGEAVVAGSDHDDVVLRHATPLPS